MTSVHALRAHQLDALRLDADAEGALAGQASTALRALVGGFSGGGGGGLFSLFSDLPPYAIRAILRAVILGATLFRRSGGGSGGRGRATPGMRYLNLQYGAMPLWRLWLLYAAAILAPVLQTRAPPRLRAALHMAAFAHRLRFMREGARRAWPESISAAEVTYGPGGAAAVPLELLNRQHVWRGLAAGALVFAPIIRAVPLPKRVFRAHANAGISDHNGTCPACGEQPQNIRMPHRAVPCACTFCYLCIALARDSASYRCPRCATPVVDIVRAQP